MMIRIYLHAIIEERVHVALHELTLWEEAMRVLRVSGDVLEIAGPGSPSYFGVRRLTNQRQFAARAGLDRVAAVRQSGHS